MEHKGNKFGTDNTAAKRRMEAWCAYQERSQFEARAKLRALGVVGEDAEKIIADLISSNFLNEERFAKAFAGGKFRVKQWGRIKIKSALKAHRLSDTCLRAAIESISDQDYNGAVRLLAEKKIKSSVTTDRRKKYTSAYQYLVGRGFEGELVVNVLNELIGEINNYEFRT
jgi:regulatory protein